MIDIKLTLIAVLSFRYDEYEENVLKDLKRWAAEPVQAIYLSPNAFRFDRNGSPFLSEEVQSILRFFFEFNVRISVSTTSALRYIRDLKLRWRSSLSVTEASKFVNGYKDVLQAPLQPLMDNLESQTYEVFEKDPVKYEKYQQAIENALKDIVKRRWQEQVANSIYESSMLQEYQEGVYSTRLVVTVVGAGRGPIVAAALAASQNCGVNIKVYAIEKNPNAVITLRNRIISDGWQNKVTLVATDMRNWNPPELCDIQVSELLGSFGDNELSPECLYGAQKCLKSDGVSIPASYTSFIAPIASSKLWMGARDFQTEKVDTSGLDIPFVVFFHRYFQLAEAKKLFTFAHPEEYLNIDNVDNTRYDSHYYVFDTFNNLPFLY